MPLSQLVSFLPIDTTDSYTLSEDIQVHIYSNALFLLLSLTLRFGPSSAALPWLPTPSVFPLVADGHLPLLLARRSVLDLSACGDRKLRAWGQWVSGLTSSRNEAGATREPALTSDQAHLLRAASIHAGELLRSKLAGAGAGAAGAGAGQEGAGGNVLNFDALLRREGAGAAEGRGLLVEEREIEKCGKW